MKTVISLVGSAYYGLEFLKEYILIEDRVTKYKVQVSNGVVKTFNKSEFIIQHTSDKKVMVIRIINPSRETPVTECIVEDLVMSETGGIGYTLETKEQKAHFEALLRGYHAMGYEIELVEEDSNKNGVPKTVISLDVFRKHRTLLLEEYNLYEETDSDYHIELANELIIQVPKDMFIKQPIGVDESKVLKVKLENKTTECYGYNPVATLGGKEYTLLNSGDLKEFKGALHERISNGYRIEVDRIETDEPT